MRAVLVGIAAAWACGSSAPPLHPAGSRGDEGHGWLGQASVQLLTGADADAESDADTDAGDGGDEEGDADAGDGGDEPDASQAFGGAAYGGQGYAGFVVRPWPVVPPPVQLPSYEPHAKLVGAIEGTITWRGPVPARLSTACGVVAPLRLTADRRVPDVIVYVEPGRVGRAMDTLESRPLTVGGTVVKRGCALLPAAQVAAPLPVAIEIHADAHAAALRVTRLGAPADPIGVALQPAAHRGVSLLEGNARIEAQDGTLAAAHVVGLVTPYYAITDDRGQFRIEELAPGAYEVTIWQAPLPALIGGKLVYGPPRITRRNVRVPTGSRPARVDVTIGR